MECARPVSAKIYSLAHATEDIDKVVQAMLNLCRMDIAPRIRTMRTQGHYGNPIVTILMELAGPSMVEVLLNNLWRSIKAEDRNQLYENLEGQIDQAGILHIRFDKQSALQRSIVLRDEDPVKLELRFRRKGMTPIVDQVKSLMDRLG